MILFAVEPLVPAWPPLLPSDDVPGNSTPGSTNPGVAAREHAAGKCPVRERFGERA